jgi:hypothetical protein
VVVLIAALCAAPVRAQTTDEPLPSIHVAGGAARWQLDSNQLLVKLQYAFRY